MDEHNKENWSASFDKTWQLLMYLIVLLLFIILFLFGYLFFQDSVNEFFKPSIVKVENKSLLAEYKRNNAPQDPEAEWDRVENGVHVRTGLKDDPNLQTIISTCTSCHSGKLIAQNKATRDGWKTMIVWMQKTQGLADLGSAEPIVLDYLAKHYAPVETGRRKNLQQEEIEWFVLNTENKKD